MLSGNSIVLPYIKFEFKKKQYVDNGEDQAKSR